MLESAEDVDGEMVFAALGYVVGFIHTSTLYSIKLDLKLGEAGSEEMILTVGC